MAIDSEEATIAWLVHYGYLQTATPTPEELSAAVMAMQSVYRLEKDGWAGPITKRAMSLFRCSQSDAKITGLNTAPSLSSILRWQQPLVKYAIAEDFDIGVKRTPVNDIIADGFDVYAPLTGLSFAQVDDLEEADIQILSGVDPGKGLGSPGNILAVAQSPGRSYKKLQVTFDASEPWSVRDTGPGVILRAVWMHELGHLMGLTHSGDPSDLMSPYYTPQLLTPQTNDRWRLSQLYGVPFTNEVFSEYGVGLYEGAAKVVIRTDGGFVMQLNSMQHVIIPAE